MTDPVLRPAWRLATRIAFRVCCAYFTLYVLFTQMLQGLIHWPGGGVPSIDFLTNGIVAWTGTHVFHVNAAPVVSGSGDKMFDWVQSFTLLWLALVIAAIWSNRGSSPAELRTHVSLLPDLPSVRIGRDDAGIRIRQGHFRYRCRRRHSGSCSNRTATFPPMGVLLVLDRLVVPLRAFRRLRRTCRRRVAVHSARGATRRARVPRRFDRDLRVEHDLRRAVKLFSFHLILMSLFLAAPEIGRLLRVVLADGARTALGHVRPGGVRRVSLHGGPGRRESAVDVVRRRRAEVAALWPCG